MYILSKEKEIDIAYIKAMFSEKIKPACIPSMLIFGEPGSGKTSFGKYIAETLGASFIFAPCYDGVGAEQLVYNWDLGKLVDAMTEEETKGREALKDGYLLQALKQSIDHKVVLLIDEIDKAKPSVDTFLLTYLQECMLNDPITGLIQGKKENMFIIFTSNKRRELEDALDRRFTLIREFSFPKFNELYDQVMSIVDSNINYPDAKIRVILQLACMYRNLQNVSKKPSQNQLADLIHELHSLGGLSGIGRKNVHVAKLNALMWKFSQNVADHQILKNNLSNLFPKIKKSKIDVYVGSMI